jgi:hypothetical protein
LVTAVQGKPVIVNPAGKFLVLLEKFLILALHGRPWFKHSSWFYHRGNGFIPIAEATHAHRGANRCSP